MTTIENQVREVRRLKDAFDQSVEAAAHACIANQQADRETHRAQDNLCKAMDRLNELVVGDFDRGHGFISAINQKVSEIKGQSIAKTISDKQDAA